MTDEQLRYKLYRILLYYYGVSMTNLTYYYVTQNFWAEFCKDSSLALTKSKISNFLNKTLTLLAAVEVEAATQSNIRLLNNFVQNTTLMTMMNAAFAEIGVSVSQGTTNAVMVFNMPNNTTRGLSNYLVWVFPIFSGQELTYAKKAYNTFMFNNLDLDNISNIKKQCGENCYWEYDSTKKQVTIQGSGLTYGANPISEESANNNMVPAVSDDTHTLIFNKNITRLAQNAVLGKGNLMVPTSMGNKKFNIIVFEHANTDPLTLESGWIPAPKSSSGTKPTYDIYSDHDAVLNYNYSSNANVTLHSLSEWEG